jgi:hypothetical protein
MKTKHVLILIMLFFSRIDLYAQDVPDASGKKVHFQSINQMGLIAGGYGTAFQVQSINGIRYKSLSVGAGIGLENYYERYVPLFLDLRKSFFGKTNTPFVYGDVGVNFPWERTYEKDYENEWKDDYKTGFISDLGLGYQVKGQYADLILSAGFSFQSFSKYVWEYPTGILDPGFGWQRELHRHDYNLHRLSLKVGIKF